MNNLPYPVQLGRSRRVHPVELESLVTRDSSTRLLRCVEAYGLSGPTRELAKHLVDLEPAERFCQAVKVVLFRLKDSEGNAPPPCLAAEEQVFLEEIVLSGVPTEVKHTAAALLHLPERTAIARTLRRAIAELA